MPDDRTRLMAAAGRDLEAAAADGDDERFGALAASLLQAPASEAAELLAPHLSHRGGVARVAGLTLAQLGPAGEQMLVTALKTGSRRSREVAAWALGSLPGPKAGAALLLALEEPRVDPALAAACFLSLAERKDALALPLLRERLETDLAEPPLAALLRALGQLGGPELTPDLLPYLEARAPEVRLAAAEALARLGRAEGLAALVEMLGGVGPHGESIIEDVRELGALSASVAPFLGEEGVPVRVAAAEALGVVGDGNSVSALIEALRDVSPAVRGTAAFALGRLGSPRALRPLSALVDDEFPWVRQAAVRALGMLGDRSATRAIEKRLFDRQAAVASAAQEALERLGRAQGGQV